MAAAESRANRELLLLLLPVLFHLLQICPFSYVSASDLSIKASVEPRTGRRGLA